MARFRVTIMYDEELEDIILYILQESEIIKTPKRSGRQQKKIRQRAQKWWSAKLNEAQGSKH